MGTCTWDLGPIATMKDQLLYTENESNEVSGIYVMKQGDVHKPAGKLAQFANFQYQIAHDLKWLPDGSGFLYSATNLFADAANIFHYDMRMKQSRQVTQLQGAFARRFSISPSGKWIVYERTKTKDTYENVDLWIVGIDGSAERLLVKNGLGPSWGR
jgi:Tol biopolymer transport system component